MFTGVDAKAFLIEFDDNGASAPSSFNRVPDFVAEENNYVRPCVAFVVAKGIADGEGAALTVDFDSMSHYQLPNIRPPS